MRSSGFFLIEMVVVIAIAAILATVGTLYFQEYLERARMEAQTHLLFSELLKARAQAIYQRKGTRVKFYTDRFEVYSSQTDGPLVNPLATHLLAYPIVGPTSIDFDERGMTYDIASICLQESVASSGEDSVVVHYLRTSMGKKDKGDVCKSESITLK